MSVLTQAWGCWGFASDAYRSAVLMVSPGSSLRGFRAAQGPPALAASAVQALVPTDSAQLSLQKVFFYNRETLSTDTSGSFILSKNTIAVLDLAFHSHLQCKLHTS